MKLVDRFCYFIVARAFLGRSFPAWMLEAAARHHFGERLGP